ncbi:MAG: hypothetical protein ACYC0G_09000 [Thiobacillus sp.]
MNKMLLSPSRTRPAYKQAAALTKSRFGLSNLVVALAFAAPQPRSQQNRGEHQQPYRPFHASHEWPLSS